MADTEYNFARRLVGNKPVFINAKLLGSDTETIAEFPSASEARQAFPDLKLILPGYIMFVSETCTTEWKALDDNMKTAVMRILQKHVADNIPFVV